MTRLETILALALFLELMGNLAMARILLRTIIRKHLTKETPTPCA